MITFNISNHGTNWHHVPYVPKTYHHIGSLPAKIFNLNLITSKQTCKLRKSQQNWHQLFKTVNIMRPHKKKKIKRAWGLFLNSSTLNETQLNAIYHLSFPRLQIWEVKYHCQGHYWETCGNLNFDGISYLVMGENVLDS